MSIARQRHLLHPRPQALAPIGTPFRTQLIVQGFGVFLLDFTLQRAIGIGRQGIAATTQFAAISTRALQMTSTPGGRERHHFDSDVLGRRPQPQPRVGALQISVGAHLRVLGQSCRGKTGPNVGHREEDGKGTEQDNAETETGVAFGFGLERREQFFVVVLRFLETVHNVVDLVDVQLSRVLRIQTTQRLFGFVEVALVVAVKLFGNGRETALVNDAAGFGSCVDDGVGTMMIAAERAQRRVFRASSCGSGSSSYRGFVTAAFVEFLFFVHHGSILYCGVFVCLCYVCVCVLCVFVMCVSAT